MTSNPQTSTFEYKKLTGNEQFFDKNGQPIPGLTMNEFWKYQYSNIWDIQPDIAEWLVGRAPNVETPTNRSGWSLYDIEYKKEDLVIKVEVKQSSSWHCWNQNDNPDDNYVARCVFGITKAHSDYKNKKSDYKRQGDVYVFCHLEGKDQETSDPRDLNHWHFYVVSTKTINEACPDKMGKDGKLKPQNTITLERVKELAGHETPYEELAAAVEREYRK